jgi:hypothetical protein
VGKRLTITYGDVVLYDDEPEKVSWSESDNGITVKAGVDQPNPVAAQFAQKLQQAIAAKKNGQ